jgi:hypothetical protein
MEAKDYTNIAGTPFQPFVDKQIEARKKLIAKEDRSSKDLLWLNNKSAWIRVSSGTNVNDENQSFIEVGDTLSRKYILQAGLTDHSKVINEKDNTHDKIMNDLDEGTDMKYFFKFYFDKLPLLKNNHFRAIDRKKLVSLLFKEIINDEISYLSRKIETN